MKKISYCLLPFMALAFHMPAFGAHPARYADEQPALHSESLVRSVIAANPQLKSGSATVGASQARTQIAGTLEDPTLSYTLAPQTLGASIGDRHSISLSQTLPWPGKRQLSREISEAQLNADRSALVEINDRLSAEARTLWAQWWFTHQALSINAANQLLLDDLLPAVSSQYASGRGSQQDVLQVQTSALHNRHRRVLIEQQQRQLSAQLNALQNQAIGSPIAKPAAMPALAKPLELSALQQALHQQHPQLQILDHRRTQAEAALALSEKAFFPDFKINAAYVGTLDPNEKRLQLGVGINLPIFQGRRRAAVNEAEYSLIAIEADKRALANRLLALLETVMADIHGQRHIVELYTNQLLPLAAQNVSAARDDYESGAGSFSEITAAAERELNFKLELARARADLFIARAKLTQLTGAPFLNSAEEK